jgi:hypothetical protein
VQGGLDCRKGQDLAGCVAKGAVVGAATSAATFGVGRLVSPLLSKAAGWISSKVAGIFESGTSIGGRATAEAASTAADTADLVGPESPYVRPSGATTAAQRASVQGLPCVDCGAITGTQVADHITPLVQEW